MPDHQPMERPRNTVRGWHLLVAGVLVGVVIGTAVRPLWQPKPYGSDGSAGAPVATRPTPGAAATQPAHRFVPDKPLANRVLIVTIDGLRPDIPAMAAMPNLRALAAAGSYTFWAQTVADPYVYTLPAHVSILTGVNPDRHGVTWNRYIEQSYSQVPTVFELAKARGLTTALVSGKMKFIALTKPGTLDWTYLPPDEPVTDALVAAKAVEILRKHRPNVLFVHFPGVDTAGHESGWGSPQQRAAAEAADAALGEVLSALQETGLSSGTIVLLTADHGGQGLAHTSADPRSRTVPWIAAGPGIRRDADLTRIPSLAVRAEDTFATACGALGIPLPAGIEGQFIEGILESRELLFPMTAPATQPRRLLTTSSRMRATTYKHGSETSDGR